MIDPDDRARPAPAYELGHSDRELERLSAQARLLDPITRRIFLEAGIVPGMRVLDVGSGAGDVAFLAADIVGPRGEVIGADTSLTAVASARSRGHARTLHHVTFREGDPTEMEFDRPFDAVVGRYILMWQGNPAAMLRRLAGHVRPGGVIVFHELDWGGVRSLPPCPTYDRCCQWVFETLRLSNVETRMGTKLYSAFLAAGLPAPSMRLEAVIGGSEGSSGRVRDLAETMLPASLLPAMERLGVATAAEVGFETLAERMYSEIAATGGAIVGRSEVGAWTRA